ncbi:MAG TPA: hypothetical protein VIK81_02135 [Patescibacteria group bacterium]
MFPTSWIGVVYYLAGAFATGLLIGINRSISFSPATDVPYLVAVLAVTGIVSVWANQQTASEELGYVVGKRLVRVIPEPKT